jgi:hypothetical protein
MGPGRWQPKGNVVRTLAGRNSDRLMFRSKTENKGLHPETDHANSNLRGEFVASCRRQACYAESRRLPCPEFSYGIRHSREPMDRFTKNLERPTESYGLSVAAGDLQFLGGRWCVTHSGLLRIAQRRHCAGIRTCLLKLICIKSKAILYMVFLFY